MSKYEPLWNWIRENGTDSFKLTFEEIEDYILANVEEGDLVMTMGAGDVYRIGDHCLEKTK